MQLKLLNFYKFLSNFANNLVGAFVPLIIFIETGELYIAFVYLVVHCIIRMVANYALKNQIRKRPQIFLILRIFTLTGYSIFILLLEQYLWLSVIGICIFLSLDYSFKLSANEIIYNYSSLNKSTDSLGITRVFEQLGIIVSLLIGGFLLDQNRELVVIISLILYGFSVIPLGFYYVKSKKSTAFNKDAVSNALLTFEKKVEHTKVGKKIVFQILLTYCIVYFIFSSFDVVRNIYAFDLFISGSQSYGQVGIFSAIFNATFGLGSYFAGKLNDRYDIMWLVQLTCVIMGLSVIAFTFTSSIYVIYILFGLTGLFYPFLSLFVFQRLIVKSRILGVSNSALLARDNSAVGSYTFIYLIAMACSLLPTITLVPIYIIIGALMLFSTYYVPKAEERTRKLLVDYLQNNEIRNQAKTTRKRVRRRKTTNKKSAT